jgi:hypothetical protein
VTKGSTIHSRHSVPVLLIISERKKGGRMVRNVVGHARGTAYVFYGAYRGIDQHLWQFDYPYCNHNNVYFNNQALIDLLNIVGF